MATAYANEYQVAVTGSDTNDGGASAPFRSIRHAAELAQPGDVITVHEGIYRERITPPRGGTSDTNRIVYQAAPHEKVVITGAEPVKNWVKVKNDTWRVTLPNSFFGNFNPYSDLIHGDWFDPHHRYHHTGCVYLNGDWFIEAANFGDVLRTAGPTPLWFAKVDGDVSANQAADVAKGLAIPQPAKDCTDIYAQFPGVDPNVANVEINVRQTVFTPAKVGINYITVRGFDLRDAATNWAPPTAGQIGLITAYWSKGWIIENNEISYSKCSGVALGKYSDEWDNRSANSAEGYVGTINRALAHGWNKETVGSHIVRNNLIHHCEQTGIVGSLGCSYSVVTGNEIHDIHVRNLFGGAEMAGIKFHGAIDVQITHNHIYRCGDVGGIWLDWMAQGAQVTGNLIHDCTQCFFFEMQHGPILVANNILLSNGNSFALNSQGVAFAHNLIEGAMANCLGDTRVTPFHEAHSTNIAGMYPAKNGDSGDHRFYNNVFCAKSELSSMDKAALPCFADGNVFLKGAKPSKFDKDALVKPEVDFGMRLEEKPDGWYLILTEDEAWRNAVERTPVTTALLGIAKVSNCAFEKPDGSPIEITTDYFGNPRNEQNPFPGPFEDSGGGTHTIKVWPVDAR